MTMRNSFQDILTKKKGSKRKKPIKYRTYMTGRMIMLLIVIEQIVLEIIIIIKYEFCFKYVKCEFTI